MAEAIQLAACGRYTCAPNPCVGCLIVKDNQILARAWHQTTGAAHAEINALKTCANASDSTVYLTLEPCAHQGLTPPCVDALIAANVRAVIIAMADPNPQVAGAGIAKLTAAGIHVRVGLLEAESHKLNRGFIKRMLQQKPYTRCKLAMSLDGKTALANGASQWISSTAARSDVHRFRAAACAVLTSADNILQDDPLLTARDLEIEFKPALRVIVDRQLKTPDTAKLLSVPGKVIIYTARCDDQRRAALEQLGVTIIYIPQSQHWLAEVVSELATQQAVNELMIEAGATLSGALIEAGLVDEIILYMAPMLLGHDGLPLLKLNQIDTLQAASKWRIADLRQFGQDVRFILTP